MKNSMYRRRYVGILFFASFVTYSLIAMDFIHVPSAVYNVSSDWCRTFMRHVALPWNKDCTQFMQELENCIDDIERNDFGWRLQGIKIVWDNTIDKLVISDDNLVKCPEKCILGRKDYYLAEYLRSLSKYIRAYQFGDTIERPYENCSYAHPDTCIAQHKVSSYNGLFRNSRDVLAYGTSCERYDKIFNQNMQKSLVDLKYAIERPYICTRNTVMGAVALFLTMRYGPLVWQKCKRLCAHKEQETELSS